MPDQRKRRGPYKRKRTEDDHWSDDNLQRVNCESLTRSSRRSVVENSSSLKECDISNNMICDFSQQQSTNSEKPHEGPNQEGDLSSCLYRYDDEHCFKYNEEHELQEDHTLDNEFCDNPELQDMLNDDTDENLQMLDIDDADLEKCNDDCMFTNTVSKENDDDVQPLFPGANITLGAFMLILALFTTKHNSVGDGIQQLLNIIAFILPNNHKLCLTLHAFKSYFKNLRNPLVKHYFCAYCLGYIEDKSIVNCPHTFCGKQLDDTPYFLEMPLLQQLQNFFTLEGFYKNLQGRFDQKHPNKYRDIHDGLLYKSYFENGPLSSPDNISFIFNTDGAPVFKSSKVSIWPLYLAINELPYKLRMKKENMILAGLWFGNQKPAMSTFLKPFMKSFTKLEEGIQVVSPDRGEFICRGFLLCGTADLPARCLLCNSVQFNGSFSCWKCIQKGNTAAVGKGHAHVYPYDNQCPKGPPRTVSNTLTDSINAINNQKEKKKNFMEHGVKGLSWLHFFPRFNIIDGIAIDYMHGVLLGVQKLLIRLWFSSDFVGKSFNIHKYVCDVDKRLLMIKPTANITRLPRSIENHFKYWKASEFRSFLLYYGGPVLYGILDDQRLFHYLLLVDAIHILLTNGSVDEDIMTAENMLLEFCGNFEKLYDKCYMTLNLHQLVHLADSVRMLGPLYTHSCFSFEDKNGFVLKMIQGTQNIDSQITTGISVIQKLPELKQRCIKKGSVVEKLCNSIENPNVLKRGKILGKNVYVLGAINERKLNEEDFNALCTYLSFAPLSDKFLCFNRLEIQDYIVYGLDYYRMTKRNNSTIMYEIENVKRFGCVRFFFEFDEGEFDCKILAVIEEIECTNFNLKCNILTARKSEKPKLAIIPVSCFICLCMYIDLPDTSYVCLFPNNLECD